MKKLALGLSLLLLSGCAAQRYEMPAQNVLTQSQIEERYSIDRQWWKQYADPKLDALVELALERNIDLARSAISVNRALYRARQLGAELVPSFSGDGSASSRTAAEEVVVFPSTSMTQIRGDSANKMAMYSTAATHSPLRWR